MTIAQRLFQRALGADAWGRDIDWGPSSAAGVPVTAEESMRLPGFYSGVRMLASDIASCPWDVVRQRGGQRVPAPTPPWIERPTQDPNDTWQDHVSDAVTSFLTAGHLFTLAVPDVFRPEMLFVLDPMRCSIVRYRGAAIAYYVDGVEVGPSHLVSIPLVRLPGKCRGIGPVEAGLHALGEGLAAQEYAGRFFSNGALLDVVIEAPQGMADTDIKRLVAQMRRRHTGVRNSHAIGALTGGAKINRIAATPQESQLLDLRKFSVQDQARLLGVPSFYLGDVTPGAVSYASTEISDRRYVRQGVTPLVTRIENGYRRLLPEGDQLKGNLAGLMRGDRKARWETYGIGLDKQVITRDEVRAWEDLPPADEAMGVDTKWGGFLETPNNSAPGDPAKDEPDDEPDQDEEPAA